MSSGSVSVITSYSSDLFMLPGVTRCMADSYDVRTTPSLCEASSWHSAIAQFVMRIGKMSREKHTVVSLLPFPVVSVMIVS